MNYIIPNDIQNAKNTSSNNNNYVTGPPMGADESSGLFSNGVAQKLNTSYINPINIKTVKQYISIDSKFRPNYFNTKSTNFEINLPNAYPNILSMSLKQVSLPCSYYSISKTLGNSTFNVTKSGTVSNITIPDGNYAPFSNISSFVTGLPGGVSFTIDSVSGRASFTNTSGGDIIITFNVDSTFNIDPNTPLPLRCGWQLGFRSASYTVQTGATFSSEGICMITGPQYGFLSINDYQMNECQSYTAMYSSSVLQKNILDRIELSSSTQKIMNGGLFCVINPDKTESPRTYFGPVNINRLKIGLYDEYGRIIDLNNMDWSFVLELETLYK
uniref:Uncharacterized protein n=1 Tax=viral metagenome TaxID=1070528 RepID=A0A6C0HQL7_9ZZZZ